MTNLLKMVTAIPSYLRLIVCLNPALFMRLYIKKLSKFRHALIVGGVINMHTVKLLKFIINVALDHSHNTTTILHYADTKLVTTNKIRKFFGGGKTGQPHQNLRVNQPTPQLSFRL